MTSLQDMYNDIDRHLLEDERPSLYFRHISGRPLFQQFPFSMLTRLKDTKQSPKHHPEGSVWNHTMLVVDEAAKVKDKSLDQRVFMWAALLHDIGKPGTTKKRNGRLTSYEHEKLGADLSEKFLKEFTDDNGFIDKVAVLVRWHMQILFVVNDLPYAEVKEMKKQSDIKEIALLGLCDRLGRLGADLELEESNINIFLRKCEPDQCSDDRNHVKS